MTKRTRFSPEIQERAVRLVQEHRPEYETQRAAITCCSSITARATLAISIHSVGTKEP